MRLLVRSIIVPAVLLLTAALAPSAWAQGDVPTAQDRVDAKAFARDYWLDRGYETTCYGVRVATRPMWHRNVRDALGYVRTGHCTIWLNSRFDWSYSTGFGHHASWWKTCRVVIHEFGHLPGIERPHTWSGIMARGDGLNVDAWWWPYHPACRYDGDDADDDGWPDY